MAGTLSSSFFIGTLASCSLYGVYYVLFGATLYVLCFKRRTRFKTVLLLASIVICVMTTMIMVLFNAMLYDAVIVNSSTVDPSLFLVESYFRWKGTLVFTLSIADMIVLDAVLVYRGLAVWSYRWPILVPSLILWLFTFGFAFFLMFKNATANVEDIPGLLRLSTYSTVWLAASVAQNVLTTLLIAYRLWSVDAAVSHHKQTKLLPVMWIMVESGALYSAAALAYTVTQVDDVGNAMDALQQIIIPIGGITFSLIIVRVGLGLTSDSESYSTSAPTQQTASISVAIRQRIQTEMTSQEDRSADYGAESAREKQSEVGSSADDVGRAT